MKRKFGIPALALVMAMSSVAAVALPSAAMADQYYSNSPLSTGYDLGTGQPYYLNQYGQIVPNPYANRALFHLHESQRHHAYSHHRHHEEHAEHHGHHGHHG